MYSSDFLMSSIDENPVGKSLVTKYIEGRQREDGNTEILQAATRTSNLNNNNL